MSKAHRGKGLLDRVSKGRGTCPACKRTGIKIIHEVSVQEKSHSVCKECSKGIQKGKISL
ncbi:MAG: hypothetical protein ACRCVN_00030 [Spirochaetia bacterium]